MATLVLTAVGTALGGPIGGMIGAVIGQQVDGRLFAPAPREGPRLADLSIQTSSYGTAIPKLFGTMRVAGTVIWATDLIEHRRTEGGGKGRPKTVSYSYSANFAVALSGRPIRAVRRIWADGNLLRGAAGDWKAQTGFRLHSGDEDQAPDSLIASAESAGAPAYRGTAYAVFEGLALESFGNRIPSLTFEVVADEAPVEASHIVAELAEGLVEAGPAPRLHGYAVGGDTVRGCAEQIMRLAGLWVRDDGTHMVVGCAEEPRQVLSASEACAAPIRLRKSGDALPCEVAITYHDVARDFQAGMQRARTPGRGRSVQLAAAVALEAGEAKALAQAALSRDRAEQTEVAAAYSWAHADLPGGAFVRSGDAGPLMRVWRLTLEGTQAKIEMVPLAQAIGIAPPAEPGQSVSEVDAVHGPTVLRLLDVPVGGEPGGDRPHLLALAAGLSRGWRRAALSVSSDGGASWSELGGTAAPAVLGSTLMPLQPAGSTLFQTHQVLNVALLHEGMELESRSDAALIDGANLAVIGDELIQFGRADRIGPSRYRLSRLLRGRRGTERTEAHPAGQTFALVRKPMPCRSGRQPERLAARCGCSPAASETRRTAFKRCA